MYKGIASPQTPKWIPPKIKKVLRTPIFPTALFVIKEKMKPKRNFQINANQKTTNRVTMFGGVTNNVFSEIEGC